MRRTRLLVCLAATAALFAIPASAHHCGCHDDDTGSYRPPEHGIVLNGHLGTGDFSGGVGDYGGDGGGYYGGGGYIISYGGASASGFASGFASASASAHALASAGVSISTHFGGGVGHGGMGGHGGYGGMHGGMGGMHSGGSWGGGHH